MSSNVRTLQSVSAEITGIKWEESERTDALTFECPMCEGEGFHSHSHIIPFRFGEKAGRNIGAETCGGMYRGRPLET